MKQKLILVLFFFIAFSCKKVDVSQQTNEVVQVEVEEVSNESSSNEQVVNIWSAYETKLPEGKVYRLDCADANKPTQNTKNNYVTIRRPNNYLTIVRDIDEDLYLNLSIGDVIQ